MSLPPAKLYVYCCCWPLWSGGPVKSSSVPGVVPTWTSCSAARSPANGSLGSGVIGPGLPTFPCGSTVTCSPGGAVRTTWFLPSTSSLPSNSLITIEPSAFTTTSNLVPRTEAVVVLPTTWNVAPPARCWTVLRVRPIFAWIEMSWTLPSLLKWALVTVITELEASRVVVPSGKRIWPRPLESVFTESPGSTMVPEVAVA